MMRQSIFVHQTYGRCWCSQSKRDALVFFPTPVGWHFLFSISPQKQFTNIPHMFHLMCNVRHWFAGNHWTSGRPPTQMFNPRRWFSLFALPNYFKTMFAFSLGLSRWVFGRKFVTMLVTLCLFCCIHCFWTPEKTRNAVLYVVLGHRHGEIPEH